MALAIAQTITANGGTNQASVTTGSFTPANGSLIVVRGSCYASSGDDTSANAITDSLGLTWTKRVERTQNQDGAGINPPPITIWTAIGTGAAMTVTTSAPVGTTGFAHAVVVWVITGQHAVTPVVDTAEESTVAGVALTLDTPVADCLLLAGMCDWGNASDVPDADANTTNSYAIANADIQSSWGGFRSVGAAGSYVIGTDALASPQGTNAVAIAIQPGATATNVNAGVATATAAVPSTTDAVAPHAGGPAAAGVSNPVSASLRPTATAATATGAAHVAAAALAPSAGSAAGTGSAFGPAASLAALAGIATAGATAQLPSLAIAASAQPATGAGVANQPTVSTGNLVSALAGVATATATAWRAVARRTITRPNTGTIIRPHTGIIMRP